MMSLLCFATNICQATIRRLYKKRKPGEQDNNIWTALSYRSDLSEREDYSMQASINRITVSKKSLNVYLSLSCCLFRSMSHSLPLFTCMSLPLPQISGSPLLPSFHPSLHLALRLSVSPYLSLSHSHSRAIYADRQKEFVYVSVRVCAWVCVWGVCAAFVVIAICATAKLYYNEVLYYRPPHLYSTPLSIARSTKGAT